MRTKFCFIFLLLSNLAFDFTHAATFNFTPFKLPYAQSEGSYDIAADYGKKTIVINFFASWCTSCIQELPELRTLKNSSTKSNIVFVAINAGEKDSVIKKFLKQHDFPYIILKDADRVISKSLGVEDLPRTVVISSDKKIVFDGNRPPATLP